MTKDYKKLLKQNPVKQSVPEALFGKGLWEAIYSTIAVLTIWIVGVIVNTHIFCLNGNQFDSFIFKIFSIIMEGTFLLCMEISVLFITIGIILIIYETITVYIPVRLQRRYLPLTKEELGALSFETRDEFYNFLVYMCSRKPKFYKETIFVGSMRSDIWDFIRLYNELNNIELYNIDDCPEELREYLEKEIPQYMEEE